MQEDQVGNAFYKFAKEFIYERIKKASQGEAAMPMLVEKNPPLLLIHIIPKFTAFLYNPLKYEAIKQILNEGYYLSPIGNSQYYETRTDIDGIINFLVKEDEVYSYTKLFNSGIVEIVDNLTDLVTENNGSKFFNRDISIRILNGIDDPLKVLLGFKVNNDQEIACSISILNVKGFKLQSIISREPNPTKYRYGALSNNVIMEPLIIQSPELFPRQVAEILNSMVKRAFG